MSTISIKKHKAVTGLSWNSLARSNYKAESVTLSENEESPFGLINASGEGSNIQRQVGLSSEKSSKGAYSAAGVFAKTVPNGMIVDITDDDQVWWCATVNGQVLQISDKVSNKEEIFNENGSFMDFIVGISPDELDNDFKVFVGSDVSQDLVGYLDGFSIETLSLESIIDEYGKNFPKDFSSVKISSLAGISPLVLVLVFGILAFSGWFFLMPSDDAQQLDMDADEPLFDDVPASQDGDRIQSRQDPQTHDKPILEEARRAEIKNLSEVFSKRMGHLLLSDLVTAVSKTPIFVEGWVADRITYDGEEAPLRITVFYDKNYGTPSGFRDYWDKRSRDVDVFISGDRASVILDIEKTTQSIGSGSILDKLESEKDHVDLMSSLDRYFMDWNMTDMGRLHRGRSISGLMQDDLKDKRRIPIHHYAVSIELLEEFKLKQLHNIMKGHASILINEAEFEFLQRNPWTIKGSYYELQ